MSEKSITMPHAVAEIARLVGGRIVGTPDMVLRDVNSLELAQPDELSFTSSSKHFKEAAGSRAGCVIAPPDFTSSTKTVIVCAHPKAAFVKAMWLFHPEHDVATGIDPTAVVDPSASIGSEVFVGPFATIGKGATLGHRVRISPGVTVGEDAQIGEGSVIHPGVILYHGVVVGARVTIHGGTVIGADGFGFVFEGGRHVKVPQLGNVVIEDGVEIGANCTIDRATFGSTLIKQGTKLDNLVHIAHNVSVGECGLIIAQVGIAGSSKIGNYVTLAGQVGIADHVTVEDYVTVGGQSGIPTGQHIESHQTVWGLPARPIDEVKRQAAAVSLLPKLRDRIHQLEERLVALEDMLKHSKV